jgi:hypothetical protein
MIAIELSHDRETGTLSTISMGCRTSRVKSAHSSVPTVAGRFDPLSGRRLYRNTLEISQAPDLLTEACRASRAFALFQPPRLEPHAQTVKSLSAETILWVAIGSEAVE